MSDEFNTWHDALEDRRKDWLKWTLLVWITAIVVIGIVDVVGSPLTRCIVTAVVGSCMATYLWLRDRRFFSGRDGSITPSYTQAAWGTAILTVFTYFVPISSIAFAVMRAGSERFE